MAGNSGVSRRRFLRLALGTLGVGGVAAVALPDSGGLLDGSRLFGSAVQIPAFDADRSYEYLLRQVRFGPRVPGSRSHVACRDYLREQLRRSLGTSTLQPFTLDAGYRTVQMWNIVADHDPANPRQVLLCAHWDTRPQATEEPNIAQQLRPISGANDGASGVAVLLEIASLLRDAPPPVGVRFVLFDGEDYGPRDDRMYLGARHYSQHLPRPKPEWGALLDMIGDRDLDIWRETNSQRLAPEVNDRIWRAARRAGHSDVFHDEERWTITDDHLPLLGAGVPVVDLIDFDYPYWHTLQDTADKCSPSSLRAVGETVLQAVYTA